MTEIINETKRGKVYFTDKNSLYLPAIAKACNYDVKINSGYSIQQLLNDILEYSPDYIVSNISFELYKPQMEALARIKQLLPQSVIIVTGEPFLTYNMNVTYENPFISYAIIGEPEYTLRDILEGIPDNEILGICYTDDNMQAAKNSLRPFIENLDELPFPVRGNTNSCEIELSRGCPHHCFFCIATPLRGNKTRYRSVNNIIEELLICINEYNITNFVFKTDNFNINRDWCLELCKAIIENNMKIKWSTNIQPQNIDNELAKYMKKSGCTLCNIGIESGCAGILSNIEKNITINDIKITINILKRNKIKTNNCYILGLPWDSEESIKETIQMALCLDSDDVSFNLAIPYPGTKFFVYSMINKLISGQIDFSNAHKEPVIRTHKLSKEKLSELRELAIKRYYARPKYLLKSILTLDLKLFLKTAKLYFSGFNIKVRNKKNENYTNQYQNK